ncbi:MAG: hypothetical protein ACFCVC_05165 [Acidimicrobiia bacterium]
MTLHSVLAVRCDTDLLLHHLAGIGLAASRGTALLVDLDPASPSYPGRLTVADLVRDGLRKADLAPSKKGVAVLGNGGADIERAVELVDALAEGWPAVAVRAGSDPLPYPVVPVVPAFPAAWGIEAEGAVRQPVMRAGIEGGLVLPVLRRGQVQSMLAGRVRPAWRWVRAWSQVWERPWG